MVTGFITALVVLAIMYGWAALRPIPPIDTDFGERKVSFTTAVPADEVFRIVENIAPGDTYKLGRKDEVRGRVLLHDGMTMSSYGYFYPVDIAKGSDGQTQVTVGIKSKFPMQFGPFVRKQQEKANQKIVDALKARIEARRVAA